MKIGLTYTGSDVKHDNYVKWLREDEDIKVIKLAADNNGAELFNDCDALVLSGGIDMDPEFYKGAAHYPGMPENGFDRKRDDFEWSLFGMALKRSVPVLGICRGLQLINCYFGGDLVQDAGQLANSIHRSFKNQDLQYDRAHGLNVRPGSLLSSITNVPRGVVNSAHHQCIRNLGKGILPNAFSDDDVIEGIELADKNNKPFLLAVQWHPERMIDMQLKDSPLSRNVRQTFIQEIKSSRTA